MTALVSFGEDELEADDAHVTCPLVAARSERNRLLVRGISMGVDCVVVLRPGSRGFAARNARRRGSWRLHAKAADSARHALVGG